MRYLGQGYELYLDLGNNLNNLEKRIKKLFNKKHETLFSWKDENAMLEIVNAKANAIGLMPRVTLPDFKVDAFSSREFFDEIYRNGKHFSCRFISRDKIEPGESLEGPLVLLQEDTTTFIPSKEWIMTQDEKGFLLIKKRT